MPRHSISLNPRDHSTRAFRICANNASSMITLFRAPLKLSIRLHRRNQPIRRCCAKILPNRQVLTRSGVSNRGARYAHHANCGLPIRSKSVYATSQIIRARIRFTSAWNATVNQPRVEAGRLNSGVDEPGVTRNQSPASHFWKAWGTRGPALLRRIPNTALAVSRNRYARFSY